MRLEQLYYFYELSKHSSISKTAEDLYISQQSISKSLKDLEKELHTTLITRTNKGIIFTPEGHEVLKMAEEILTKVDTLKNKFSVSQDLLSNEMTLKILGCSAVYLSIIPQALQQLQDIFPAAHIMCMEEESFAIPLIQQQLLVNEPNIPVLGIINRPNPKIFTDFIDSEIFNFETIYKNDFVVFVNTASPLAKNKSVSMKTLLKYPAIIFSPSYAYKSIDLYMLEKFGEPQVNLIIDVLPLLIQALESNKGYCILPSLYASFKNFTISSNITHIHIKENITSYIGCIFAKQYTNNQMINPFIEILKNLCYKNLT